MVEREDGTVSWELPRETNIEIAGNLQGRLLIVQGTMDRIVHPAHAVRLADALIRAGKRFDYFVVPGGTHALDRPHEWPYIQRLVADYFADHLIGDRRGDVDIFADDPKRP